MAQAPSDSAASAPSSSDPPPATNPPGGGGGPTPYIVRKIDVTLTIGTGNFGEQGKTTVTLRGYRVQCSVNKAFKMQGHLQLRIYGMKFSQMQAVVTNGLNYSGSRKNGVRVDAGDDVAGMSMIFSGSLQEAYIDGESQPDVALQIVGNEGNFENLKPAPPISIAGSVDVATVIGSLAAQMGKTFENHGVTAKLRDVYYPGTAYQQMTRIAEHAGINATLENGVVAIWPRGVARGAVSVPLFSPDNLSNGYPVFNSNNIIVRALFRPIILDQKVAVQSSIWDNKTRYYTPNSYTYDLACETPNGPWFTTFMALVQPQ